MLRSWLKIFCEAGGGGVEGLHNQSGPWGKFLEIFKNLPLNNHEFTTNL